MTATKISSRRTSRHAALVAALIVPVLVLSAACGSKGTPAAAGDASGKPVTEQQLVDAAKKEGGLTAYGNFDAKQAQAYFDGFAKQYGLSEKNFKYVQLPADSISQRFLAGAKANKSVTDFIFTGYPSLYEDNPQLFKTLNADTVPGLATYPAKLVEDQKGILISLATMGISYNTNLVKASDIPKSWSDVANPAFKGKVVVNDPRALPAYALFFHDLGQDFGSDLLTKVGNLGFTVQASGSAGVQSLASGSAAINYPTFASFIAALPAGAPVAFVLPDGPSSYGTEHDIALPALADHPATAQLFANWLLTEAGHEVACQPQWAQSMPDPSLPGGSQCAPIKGNFVSASDPAKLNDLASYKAQLFSQLKLQ